MFRVCQSKIASELHALMLAWLLLIRALVRVITGLDCAINWAVRSGVQGIREAGRRRVSLAFFRGNPYRYGKMTPQPGSGKLQGTSTLKCGDSPC